LGTKFFSNLNIIIFTIFFSYYCLLRPNPSHLRKPDFGDDFGGGFGRGRGGFGGGGFGGGGFL
jgi:hypothetical protein